jgi:Flp pilus assembly protein TadG
MKMVRGKLRLSRRAGRENGQALLELALTIPLLLGLAFNTINFSYYWFAVLEFSAVPRQAAQYASQGSYSEGAPSFISNSPTVTSVCNLLAENFGNAVLKSSSFTCGSGNVQIRICSTSNGLNADGTTKCTSYGPSLVTFATAPADPEQPIFATQRVDIAWHVRPPISGTVFNIFVPSNLNFARHVAMRNLY